jgi:hypothetical protein
LSDEKPRRLGVIEAFTAVIHSCPNGSVRAVAENALATVKRDGAAALPEQAFLVLSAVRGWRGDRATQVKAALETFLATVESPPEA